MNGLLLLIIIVYVLISIPGMVYALHPVFSFISLRTFVRGMALTATKIAHTKQVTNYSHAIKMLSGAAFVFNQKANIATGNNDIYIIPENEYCYRKANA